MKRSLLVIFAILCLILCLGLASCGGNDNPGTENGGTENGGTENGGTEDKEDYITITFDTKGGSTLDSIQLEKGSKIPKPQDPTRAGYTFVDWQYSGEKWSFIGYVATEDMTLEASWATVTYIIEYVGAIGEKKTYTIEDEFDLEGRAEGVYIFQGWYLDEELTKPISKIENGTTGDLKLYGKTKDSGLKVELKGNEYAVVGCDENVTSVVIPETCNGLRITSIGDVAFRDCTGLTSVVIPNSVTSIGHGAFYGCTGLTSVTIGDGVTSIGYGAFEGCTGLTSIIVDEGNPSYESIGGNLYSKDEKTLVQYAIGKKDTSFVIPSSVTAIVWSAFSGCTGLTSVEIPNSVTTIGSSAFSGCTGLTSIIVDEGNPSYKSIDGNLYSKDEKAFILYAPGKKDTTFVIPNGVTSIGDYAFLNCTGLTSVTIPNSVTSIGNYAFDGCTGLTSVEIPNSVTKIGYCAFRDCAGLTNVTIGDDVTSIGYYAFSGCTGLTSIEIPNSVTIIDDYAFWDCTGLTSVAIPNSVTIIGASAFDNCTGLTSVVIPNSVTTIGNYAFSGCTGLTIYCEAESKPNGWNSAWNYSDCPVVWGHKMQSED